MSKEKLHATIWALVITAILARLVALGAVNLEHFDAALVAYTFATLFAVFGILWRYLLWLQRPPTAMYWTRGWIVLFRFLHPRYFGMNVVRFAQRLVVHFVFNGFIWRRGRLRWVAHWFTMWGTLSASAITFPLVFGWVYFATEAGTQADDWRWYRVHLFGFPTLAFPIDSLLGFVIFHGLVWSSILVIIGVMAALRRRWQDRGALALQQLGHDILPLFLLFAISVTGLMLTASYTWMKGYGYDFLAILHAVTVIFTLLWLPFGKFFHIFQRSATIGVAFYKDVGRQREQARCRRCNQEFASRMHIEDLIAVEKKLGYAYEMPGSDVEHFQWICPKCRRASLGLAQGALWAAARRTSEVSEEFGSLAAAGLAPLSPADGGEGRRRGAPLAPQRAIDERRRGTMALLPAKELPIIEHFGPHRNYSTRESAGEPDRLVKTHCCFCGMQCGIQLAVRDDRVVGFEPWEEFPFNQGMLCPKGVKRYLQGGHPDRLLSAYRRDPAAPAGFRAIGYDDAIRHTADEIKRIQTTYGPESVAVIGGASLTTEKAYLLGKFARVALKTPYIDYNGRLCMVSAAAANKKAFGIDRAANPWADLLDAKLIWVSGANIGECFPILTNYLWQARENGARIIVVDPRITPIARTCDLFLPIKPGRDIALFNGILHLMVRNGWLDQAFIDEHTVGFDRVADHVQQWTPQRTAEVTGIAERAIRTAAEWWGTAPSSFLLHARGIEHHSHGVQNCLGAINLVLASGRIGRPGCGYATITGQGNGQGGREHGQKCDQLPGGRDIENAEHRAHVAQVWGVAAEELPRAGVDVYEIFRKIDRGEIRALLSLCINPVVSLPNNGYIRAVLEQLQFFGVIDFFMSETARYADVVLPSALQEEDEGIVTSAEGRVIKINRAIPCPGDARPDWQIIQDIARALGKSPGFTFEAPRAIFEELRRASAGGIADYSGITYERIEQEFGVFWPCPHEDHPGTPRLFEPDSYNPIAEGRGRFYFPDGKARFHVAPYTPPAEEVDDEYPVILTSGRVVSQYLSGTQTRRIGPLVDQYPEPRVEMHPLLAEKRGIKDGEWVRIESRRHVCTLRAQLVTTIRPDTIFVPYHWGGAKSINQVTIDAQDPISKIPEFKVCAVRLVRQYGPPAYADVLEAQQ